MAKESLLDRLRNKTTDVLDEEGKLRKLLQRKKLSTLAEVEIPYGIKELKVDILKK